MSDDKDNEFWRFKHWGPILLLSLTLLVSWTTLHMNSMWWPPGQDIGSWVNYSFIWVHVFATLYNFVRSLMVGPGFVPKKWHPERLEDTEFLQFCQRCEGYKPPRSHHCRRCDRCVLKMDHHCPWINNCVGWSNQASYVYFLLFFLSASVQGGFIISASLIRGLAKRYLFNIKMGHLATVNLTLFNVVACVGSLGVTMGMGMASIKLLYMQAKVIFTNKTEIERWIIKKAEFRRDALPGHRIKPLVFPYDIGWRANYQEVFVPSGDGYSWPVLPGCNQYTLTVEQLAQKKDKRARTRCFKCIRRATGRCFPVISQGLLVSLLMPWNDDPRIALKPGDLVQVTRFHNHWLYGERVISEEEMVEGKRREGAIKGWFPSVCVKEIHAEDSETEDNVADSGEPCPGKDETDEKLADEKPAEAELADEKLADGKLADENLSDEELADEILADEILADEKFADEILADEQDDVLAGGEGVQNKDQELKTQEYDPYFKRTLEQILKDDLDNLDDEKPPWDEEECDFGEPFPKEALSNPNPWQDGTRKRVL